MSRPPHQWESPDEHGHMSTGPGSRGSPSRGSPSRGSPSTGSASTGPGSTGRASAGPVTTGSPASAVLRERGAASWAAAVSHPMVAEIGAGSLPHETFRYYFEQNVLYLEDYARAIALIIGRAPDLAGVTVLARFLSQIVDTELPANYAFLARLGGPARPDPTAVLTPATYAYTRHLLDTAGRHDLPAGLAAVLPCQWSYGELATRLARALPADSVYADWIGMFAGDGYDELVQASTALLDH